MAETKDNTLSIIALVALVAVVGMVVAFAVSSKGGSAPQTATPVYVTTAPTSAEDNSAGMMKLGGDDAWECEWGKTCTKSSDCSAPYSHCYSGECCSI